jgi:hypothetical protein
VQQVNELQEREEDPIVRASFKDSFAAFQVAKASPLKKTPTVSNQDIDLCSLYRVVNRRGGYHVVTEAKAWRDIGRALGVSPSPLSTVLGGPILRQEPAQYRIPYVVLAL